MIRVLHVAMGSGSFGGAARFAVNYYQHMDQEKIRFDFLFCNKNSLKLVEKDPLLVNSKIFELGILGNNNKISDYIRLILAVRKIIEKEKYKIVHIDTGALPIQICCLLAAKSENVRIRIAHSHSAGDNTFKNNLKGKFKRIIKPLMQKEICSLATNYFACSTEAGLNLFGEKGITNSKFKLIKNAIDISKFSYNKGIRNEIRNNLNINKDTMVFGHVGRFDKSKNHIFLIDIYEEIYKIRPNSKLILVGDGIEADSIKKRIKKSSAQNTILLLGERNDVNNILQGLDVFLFPSHYEGLSLVAIEAQCSGLPVFASDCISKEHDVTGNVCFQSLSLSAKEWAKNILEYMQLYKRYNMTQKLIDSGYDIEIEAKKLETFYLNVFNN